MAARYNTAMPQLRSDNDLKGHLAELLRQAVAVVAPGYDCAPIVLERPKQAQHGDYACNLALQLAKDLKRNPRELAQAITRSLSSSPLLEKAEIAGPGFINLFLKAQAKQQVVRQILTAGATFGHSDHGAGKKILLEFVSSNPTGPLHVAHGRAAAYGASLANVLQAAGFKVGREYYVNDAGRQMDILTLSTWLRYLELHAVTVPFPAKGYQGEYVREMARQIKDAHGARYVREAQAVQHNAPHVAKDTEADLNWLEENKRDLSKESYERLVKHAENLLELELDLLIANAKQLLGDDYAYIHNHALTEQLGDMRNDLMEFGVHYDCWFSEQSLYDNGLLDNAIKKLRGAGQLYQQDGALWFRSSHFGDEKDRVLQRENGLYTYFAPDVAYHLNKFERGFDHVIDVWGPDHHGYIARVRAAIEALGIDPARFEVIVSQLVKLYRDGKLVKLSTRAGEYVTLRELRREVGDDAARFFYVLRNPDQQLDFDLDLAQSKTNENPVYYVQYAHARICSVHEKWGGEARDLAAVDLGPLTNGHELDLLQALADYPTAVENAAKEYAPHHVAYYLRELAGRLHSYYNAEQFLVTDEKLKLARLALITATRQVLRNGLGLLGVSAPEKMYSDKSL
jgi:arginyl-tRNA synthetase